MSNLTFLNKRQKNYMEKNNLVVINKSEIDKFKFINYKELIGILIDKICYIVFSKFKPKIINYCKSEIEDSEQIIKDEIKFTIENFMEIVYNYRPEYKRIWAGHDLRQNTIKAIKRYKFFEIFEEIDKNLYFIDHNIYMNKKKVQKAIDDLKKQNKGKKFIIKERKIV